MERFVITGGIPLKGTVRVSGSRNSALPILAACLMAEGTVTLCDVPRLHDVNTMIKLLGELGTHVYRQDNADLQLEVRDELICEARCDIVSALRASICVLGPLLAKRGKAVTSLPDNFTFTNPPVDRHFRGLQQLGVTLESDRRHIICTVKGRLKGCRISVGGQQGSSALVTINLMCAAALAEGTTALVGAASDPEVGDCAMFLNKMGAKISGYGSDEITIEGVDTLRATEHTIIPDRIEAGTLAIAAAITKGNITLENCERSHLDAQIRALEQMGVGFASDSSRRSLEVLGYFDYRGVEITTGHYPEFP